MWPGPATLPPPTPTRRQGSGRRLERGRICSEDRQGPSWSSTEVDKGKATGRAFGGGGRGTSSALLSKPGRSWSLGQAGPAAPEGHPVNFSLSRSPQTALGCQGGVSGRGPRWEPVPPPPGELAWGRRSTLCAPLAEECPPMQSRRHPWQPLRSACHRRRWAHLSASRAVVIPRQLGQGLEAALH